MGISLISGGWTDDLVQAARVAHEWRAGTPLTEIRQALPFVYEHVDAAVLDEDRSAAIAATLLAPHRADAREMIDSGYATAADIDTAMNLGCGYPRGILTE